MTKEQKRIEKEVDKEFKSIKFKPKFGNKYHILMNEIHTDILIKTRQLNKVIDESSRISFLRIELIELKKKYCFNFKESCK